MNNFKLGFLSKCAEYGVDPRIMIVNSPHITSSTGAPSSGIGSSPYGLYSGAYGVDSASSSKKSKVKKVLSTIIPLLGIAGAGAGGYYGYKKYKEHKRKQRIKDNLITGGLIAAPIAAATTIPKMLVNHEANKLVRPILNKAL
jgi:uncharacterized membrane protein YebE (DUF533 family)